MGGGDKSLFERLFAITVLENSPRVSARDESNRRRETRGCTRACGFPFAAL
jgi:hypothetical protein